MLNPYNSTNVRTGHDFDWEAISEARRRGSDRDELSLNGERLAWPVMPGTAGIEQFVAHEDETRRVTCACPICISQHREMISILCGPRKELSPALSVQCYDDVNSGTGQVTPRMVCSPHTSRPMPAAWDFRDG